MWFERIIWFPVLVAFVVALGVSGKHLTSPPAEPAAVQAILSFAGVIAGFTITYSPLGSDFTMYYSPDSPRSVTFTAMVERKFTNPSQLENLHILDPRVSVLHRGFHVIGLSFSLTYTGQVPLQCLGAACAIAAQTVPSWAAAFEGNNVSGLLAEMLSPAGTFGKILVVLLAISLTSNITATFYSITLNFQILIPRLVVLPRYLLSLAATAVYVRSRRPQTTEGFIKPRY